MKKGMALFCLLAMLQPIAASTESPSKIYEGTNGILKLYFSPEFGVIGTSVKDAYSISQSEVTLELMEIQKQELGDWLQESGRIALVTKDDLDEIDPTAVKLSVIGREVYVPVMNPMNPCREEIQATGISTGEFARLFVPSNNETWGSITASSCKRHINAYRVADKSFMNYLSKFTGMDSEAMGGIIKPTCSDVIAAVKSDPLAIGFCKLSQLYSMEKAGSNMGVIMVPVDVNGNNHLDAFENIYVGTSELSRGLWIGKYPTALYSRLYAVTSKNSFGKAESAFISWMVTDGQKYLTAAGYTGLMENEKSTILAALNQQDILANNQEEQRAGSWVLILGIVAILTLLLILVFRRFFVKKEEIKINSLRRCSTDNSDIAYAPDGYFIDSSHTWTYLERNGELRVGIDQFLSHITGEISRFIFKAPGEKVQKGEKLLAIVQKGKTMEIFSPVTGTIISVNESLSTRPFEAEGDPYEAGWIYKIKSTDWISQIDSFKRGNTYREWIESEVLRLKDFVARKLKPLANSEAVPVFQEGGEPVEGLLELFGPREWEEFQISFLKIKH